MQLESENSSGHEEGRFMCDYSLGGIPNRLAVADEGLVVHKFPTGSMGLACPADLEILERIRGTAPKKGFWRNVVSILAGPGPFATVPAVCIPPGARVIVKDIPADLGRQYGLGRQEGAVFTQLSADAYSYRDAVRFPNGAEIRLQELREGMRVEILSLNGPREDEELVARNPQFSLQA
jgi:hypothetical protein